MIVAETIISTVPESLTRDGAWIMDGGGGATSLS